MTFDYASNLPQLPFEDIVAQDGCRLGIISADKPGIRPADSPPTENAQDISSCSLMQWSDGCHWDEVALWENEGGATL